METDATVKELLEESPAAWPWLVGAPAQNVEVIDSDVSTITGAADKVLRVRDEPQWIHHVEFQSGPDPSLPRRGNVYNAVLEHRHGLPVRSTFVLLSRKANLTAIDGRYECRLPGRDRPYRVFEYDVIRVWEVPPERFLTGGLSLVPLAPIGAVTEAIVADVVEEMKQRLRPVPESLAGKLWTAARVLMGLRYEKELVRELLKEVTGMKDSVTYQEIVEEGVAKGIVRGRQEGAVSAFREALLVVGRDHLGKAPGARVKAAVEAIDDLEELKRLTVRALHVSTWEELLSLPERPKRRKS
jgi:predicted transposase YdaD